MASTIHNQQTIFVRKSGIKLALFDGNHKSKQQLNSRLQLWDDVFQGNYKEDPKTMFYYPPGADGQITIHKFENNKIQFTILQGSVSFNAMKAIRSIHLPTLFFILAMISITMLRESQLFGQAQNPKQISSEIEGLANQDFQQLSHQEQINFIIHQKIGDSWRLEALGDFINHPDDLKYINQIRETDMDYPFTAFGDFDHDGNEDVALKVTKNGESKLVIYRPKKDKLFWWRGNVVRAVISKSEPDEITSFNGKKNLEPKGDLINVEFLEVAAYYIYWIGKKFKQLWYSD